MLSPENHFLPFLLLLLLLHNTTATTATSSLTTLIYKGCANQNFQNPFSSEDLKTLFAALITESSLAHFYKTTYSTVTGLFQCRGDLSLSDCNSCVKTLPGSIQKLCNPDTQAARAHLVGCYMRYEVVGFPQVPSTEMLYKKCGSSRVVDDGPGFDEKLDGAFGLMVKGVSNGKGYFAGGYENVYILGQCEGDLGGGECVNCVKSATDMGRNACRRSVSGHVFLQQCYVSYTYYPDGVPGSGGNVGSVEPGGGVGGVETQTGEVDGGGGRGKNDTQKTVAIVFGGLAGLGLVVALLLVVKSNFRKKKEHYSYGVQVTEECKDKKQGK
uniref:plasmodesmata-located protein 2 isoform X2 n=1 Tax=Erigeron canadensis TaxID=72917 RepID=UPI001CB8AF69|nr:plasmodesmata-located protein 2 isoform X2 [Erigeron canadensis]